MDLDLSFDLNTDQTALPSYGLDLGLNLTAGYGPPGEITGFEGEGNKVVHMSLFKVLLTMSLAHEEAVHHGVSQQHESLTSTCDDDQVHATVAGMELDHDSDADDEAFFAGFGDADEDDEDEEFADINLAFVAAQMADVVPNSEEQGTADEDGAEDDEEAQVAADDDEPTNEDDDDNGHDDDDDDDDANEADADDDDDEKEEEEEEDKDNEPLSTSSVTLVGTGITAIFVVHCPLTLSRALPLRRLQHHK